MKKKAVKVAELIIKTLKMQKNKAVLEEVRSEVKALTDASPAIRGLILLWTFILRKPLSISSAQMIPSCF